MLIHFHYDRPTMPPATDLAKIRQRFTVSREALRSVTVDSDRETATIFLRQLSPGWIIEVETQTRFS